MSKSKKQLFQVARLYIDALKSRFPGIEAEPILDAFGFDLWIRIDLPPLLEERNEEVTYATTELNFKFWDETGVNITATVEEKESAHG